MYIRVSLCTPNSLKKPRNPKYIMCPKCPTLSGLPEVSMTRLALANTDNA